MLKKGISTDVNLLILFMPRNTTKIAIKVKTRAYIILGILKIVDIAFTCTKFPVVKEFKVQNMANKEPSKKAYFPPSLLLNPS